MKHSRVGGGSPLCTTTTFGYLSDAGEEPCPRCELLVATLKTNAGACAYGPPFRSDYFGRWTQGAKFYASAILGQVHDSALYNRWTAARTFEHLQAFVVAYGYGASFVGCVDCGAKPHPNSAECPVCGRHAPPPVRTESNEHP